MMATRFAFDILIWLIPIPFVDLIFETGKKLATVIFIGLYLLAPGVALFFSIVILIASVFALGWALRLIQFAFSIALRPLLAVMLPGLRAGLVYHPLSAYSGDDVSTCDILTPGAALALRGARKRQLGALVLKHGALTFAIHGALRGKPRHITLAVEHDRIVLVRTLGWVELQVMDPKGGTKSCIALPTTVLPHFDELRRFLRADDGGLRGVARILATPPAFNRPSPGAA
jgi:hypothetical protein